MSLVEVPQRRRQFACRLQRRVRLRPVQLALQCQRRLQLPDRLLVQPAQVEAIIHQSVTVPVQTLGSPPRKTAVAREITSAPSAR